ncbi:MAG: response regulator, partial [Planctomycetia bacterium]
MTAPARRVLVVEDDAAIRRGVVTALRFAGYDVLEAGDGPRGLALAESAELDLVLLDVVLPGCDGLEILRRVRESRPTR